MSIMSSFAVSNLTFSEFTVATARQFNCSWTLPTSTAGIDNLYEKWLNDSSEVVFSNVLGITITADAVYHPSYNFPDGNYNYSIHSRAADNSILGSSPVYTLTIVSHIVTQITDSNGATVLISSEGGGGGGGGVPTVAFVSNSIAVGTVNGSPVWVNAGYTVDNTSCIQTSTDGQTWTTQPVNYISAANGVAFGQNGSGNPLFVAVGDGSVITSTDGITWTATSLIAVSKGLFKAVAYGGGRWNAVGHLNGAGVIYTSTDGVTWTNPEEQSSFSLAAFTTVNGIAYAQTSVTAGAWVIVGSAAHCCIATSTDGIGWVEVSPDGRDTFYGTVQGVPGGTGLSIAVNTDGTLWVATGINPADSTYSIVKCEGSLVQGSWIKSFNNPFANVQATRMAVAYGIDVYGAPLWIATTNTTSVPFATSANGTNWTATDMAVFATPFVMTPYCIVYSSNRWVAGGDTPGTHSQTIAYSTNPLGQGTWSPNDNSGGGVKGNDPFNGAKTKKVVYGNGLWLAIGASEIFSSPDGKTWTQGTNPFDNTSPSVLNDIAFGSNTAGAPLWMCVGGNETNIVASSADGLSWTAVTATLAEDATAPAALCFVPSIGSYTNHWILVGRTHIWRGDSSGFVKTNNTTWVIPEVGVLDSVAYGLDVDGTPMVVAGGSNRALDGTTPKQSMLKTTNLSTWNTLAVDPFTDDINGQNCTTILYAGGKWLAGGTSGIFTSTNATTWTKSSIEISCLSIIYAESEYYTFGTNIPSNENSGLYKSTNGSTWTLLPVDEQPLSGGLIVSIAHDPTALEATRFVAIGESAGGTVQTKANSTTWVYNTPGENIPPSAVVDLVGIADAFSVNLTWKTPTTEGTSVITGYEVVTDPVTETLEVPLHSTGVYLVNIPGLSADLTYTFTVVAVTATGRGAPAVTSGIQPLTVSILTAPTNITVVPFAASALIGWTPPASTGGSAITGYRVYTSPDNKKVNSAGPTARSVSVIGLKNGTPYTFSVVAITSTASSYSAKCIPSTVPGAPKVTAVGGNGQVTLSWVSKPAAKVPTTGYIMTVNRDGVTLPTNPVSPVVINGLTNGVSYIFSIKAVNIIGQSLVGASKAIIPTSVPGVPTNFTVLPGIKSFQAKWDEPSTNGGLAISEYTVTYVGGGKTTVAKVKPVSTIITSPKFSLMVTKLVTGTVYTVMIQAKNKLGLSVSVSSEPSSITVE